MKFEVGCKLGTQIGPAVGPQFLTRVCKHRKGTRFWVRGGDALRPCTTHSTCSPCYSCSSVQPSAQTNPWSTTGNTHSVMRKICHLSPLLESHKKRCPRTRTRGAVDVLRSSSRAWVVAWSTLYTTPTSLLMRATNLCGPNSPGMWICQTATKRFFWTYLRIPKAENLISLFNLRSFWTYKNSLKYVCKGASDLGQCI
jgi:hypothetical protein